MASQNTTPRVMNIGTTVKPKYQVFDIHGTEDFLITSATFRLLKREDSTLIDSGSCVVNNADEDTAGNTIRTVQPTLELSATDFDLGEYWLAIRVVLNTGESDVFRQLVEVVDFEVI